MIRISQGLSRSFLRPGNMLLRGILIFILATMAPVHPLYAVGEFTGVYTGTFFGNFDDGDFSLMVRPDNTAIALFYDVFDEEGGIAQLNIENDGSFSFVSPIPPFDSVTGQISGNNIDAAICCVEPGTVVGTRSSDSGPYKDSGGLYVGELTGSGIEDGTPVTFDGQIYFIVNAPGNMMVYVLVDVFVGGAFVEEGETGGTLFAAANGTINGALPDGVTLNGSINMAKLTSTGNWSFVDPDTNDSGMWNASRTEALPVLPPPTYVDITGVTDMSGDGVADVASLSQKASDRPRVRYFSGANGDKIKTVGFLSDKWTGVAVATGVDGNRDGVADDPAVAVLADKLSNGSHKAEIRFAGTGAKIKTIEFLSDSWDAIDIAVLDDVNGDGVTNDPAIAVLGYNPAMPSKKRIKVQLRRISDGKLLKNIFFMSSKWNPIALEAVIRPGQNPLLSVLARHKTTGENKVQDRRYTNGTRFRNTTFHTTDWQAQDLALLRDTNGNGNPNDPSYLVLATNPATDENKVETKKVSNGVLKNTPAFPSSNWLGLRIMSSEDLSGNLREEVGVLAEHRNNGSIKIQLKDYDKNTTTLTITP